MKDTERYELCLRLLPKNPGLLKLKQAHLLVFLLHALFSLQLIKMPVQQPHGFFFRKKPFFHIATG